MSVKEGDACKHARRSPRSQHRALSGSTLGASYHSARDERPERHRETHGKQSEVKVRLVSAISSRGMYGGAMGGAATARATAGPI